MVMAMEILPMEARDLEIRRNGKRLLGPVSQRIESGGITIVLGPNGAGKTTFLRALHGLERQAAGHISWALPEPQTRARQAFVFQRPTCLRRSVRDNIAFPLIAAGVQRAEARMRAAQMAEQVGLQDHLDLPAQDLSGGECQKMALMRALIRGPEILFLDEPCASLDGAATSEIETILCRARDAGTTILMSTHSIGQARRLADRIIFLHRGHILEHGPAAPFFTAPQTPQAQAHIKGDLVL